ncbi:prostatic acid phosphatase [Diabrotica virgifera virgifera]|uniref:acid phosphatase n=1 Tax=Diabrotica virgifera virgifera TaxID=50390 RepID=A0ABM5ILI8_DIAVI|nr:prostatic acid phosphatase [Diabrotica virgifera virgifera]
MFETFRYIYTKNDNNIVRFTMDLVTYVVFVSFLGIIGVTANLIAVVQVVRHGQRTPITFFPTNKYSDRSYWGNLGPGQLTNEGKRQHYELGQYTRKRYSNFLPLKYNESSFAAYTTDVDRTHMSAQCNVYSLFPAFEEQMWHRNVNWQPIPIHPISIDVFSGEPACPNYNVLRAAMLDDDLSQSIDAKYARVYNYINRYTGLKIKSFSEIRTVFDDFKIQVDVGLPLPDWAKAVYPEPVTSIAGWLFESFTRTDEMKRFATGRFLNNILEYFENMSEDCTYSQKYQFYSGHDLNIASILNSFGAFNPPYPPQFASTVYMELHLEDWEPVVKVFSKDGNKIKQISVNGCPLSCPLSEFREVLSPVIVDKITLDEECRQIIQEEEEEEEDEEEEDRKYDLKKTLKFSAEGLKANSYLT